MKKEGEMLTFLLLLHKTLKCVTSPIKIIKKLIKPIKSDSNFILVLKLI